MKLYQSHFAGLVPLFSSSDSLTALPGADVGVHFGINRRCMCVQLGGFQGVLTVNESHSPFSPPLLLVCFSLPIVYLFLLLARGQGTEAKPRQGLGKSTTI